MFYCKKCGNISYESISDKDELCYCCNSVMTPIPEKYLYKGLVVADDDRKLLIEELVKPSPEFDQYLFDHRDEILAKQSAEFNAKMAIGKAIIEEQSKTVKCTYCGSSNVKKIGLFNRAISTELWGLGSKKIGKQFHCNHCGADF